MEVSGNGSCGETPSLQSGLYGDEVVHENHQVAWRSEEDD